MELKLIVRTFALELIVKADEESVIRPASELRSELNCHFGRIE